MSRREHLEPSQLQVNEANRIHARYGTIRNTLLFDGCLQVNVIGDQGEHAWLAITLDRDGRVLARQQLAMRQPADALAEAASLI